MADLSALKAECEQSITAAGDMAALEEARVATFGKKGRITELLKSLGSLPEGERQQFGAEVNRLKEELNALIGARRAGLLASELDAKIAQEKADITLSVRPENKGTIHPLSRTLREIIEIFAAMGFSVEEGPDIETDAHNFTLLNMPPDHPARQMQDTFYLDSAIRSAPSPGGSGTTARAQENTPLVLRTHTSPVQIRTMLQKKPPLRILAAGRVYRSDSDQTHAPMFHQVEGLVVDEATHMGHLKGALMEFLRAFFALPDLKVRFRPSYFPFTEPSAEVDIGCSRAGGKIKIGEGEDWLEVLGCGMVHPKVLENCKIDPNKYQGFAFGMGVERLAMLKYGVPDLRSFFEGDIRWLKHYGFSALGEV